MSVEQMNMAYEFSVFLVVCFVSLSLMIIRRCFRWPVSLRALFWCGAFSYIALLVLPRVVVWLNAETVTILVFLGAMAALLAWILAYHGI